MPVGMYSECNVHPTCGLVGVDGVIGNEDQEYSFYLPERINAGLLWSSAGFVEYKFANGLFSNDDVKRILPDNGKSVPKRPAFVKTGSQISQSG